MKTSNYLTVLTVTTKDPIPNTPTMSSSTSVTSNSFLANWSAETYADSYNVYVYTDIDLTSLFVSYTGVLTNSKSITGLDISTDYYTVVESFNESGASPKSEYILTTTNLLDLQIDSYTKLACKFDNNYTDDSGNSNIVTGVNSPTFTTPLLTGNSNSLLLDGINQVIQIDNNVSLSRNITIRAIFQYLSFARSNTYLYTEWYGESTGVNYQAKIIIEHDKTNDKFIIYLYDDTYESIAPYSNQYVKLETTSIVLNTTDKNLTQFSFNNTSKVALFCANNSEYTLTQTGGSLTLATLNLNDTISPQGIYWGGFTFPNTLDASLSPNQILSRLYIDDGIARDLTYHQQDYSNISSRF